MERREYSETMTALDGDSDFRRQLKPSALLRYVEQVSADHARAYGMDRQFFTEHHSAFLVAKTAVQITRRPMRAEKFTLTTACEVFKKGSMKRLTILTDTEGNRLALVDCRWMLVDTDTERIQRAPGWETEGFQNEELPEELPQLVHKSKDLQPAGEWVARYSLCDLNGHINNAALSGHCLRRHPAGSVADAGAEIFLHQVSPRGADGGEDGGLLCPGGAGLVCGGPQGRARRF